MDFVNLFDLPIIFMERRQQRQLYRNRIFRDQTNPFDLSDRYFIKLFRLNKDCVAEIIENLRNHLPPFTRATSLSPENRVSYNKAFGYLFY